MFKLVSKYKPTGDQPKAIETLVDGLNKGLDCQTLLGVTGSGKTFTIANVIEQIGKPTIVMAHNKTLAELFDVQRPAITKHLKNIFESEELIKKSVCSILEHTAFVQNSCNKILG